MQCLLFNEYMLSVTNKWVENETVFYSGTGRMGESLTMGRMRLPDDVFTSADRATESAP